MCVNVHVSQYLYVVLSFSIGPFFSVHLFLSYFDLFVLSYFTITFWILICIIMRPKGYRFG